MRKVLVVDDEVAICSVVAEAFEEWPNTIVECAHDGLIAVEQLHGAEFELALIDVELPGLSGLEVAEAATNDNTAVLLLAGHPDMVIKLTLVDIPHLRKPFRIEELLRESQSAVADAKKNVARVKAALDLLKARAGELQTAMEESRRLLGESIVTSARAEGRAPR